MILQSYIASKWKNKDIKPLLKHITFSFQAHFRPNCRKKVAKQLKKKKPFTLKQETNIESRIKKK